MFVGREREEAAIGEFIAGAVGTTTGSSFSVTPAGEGTEVTLRVDQSQRKECRRDFLFSPA